jgi:hypothetical protein
LFPYVHICFANDVLNKINDEIILGAVFPDIVIAGFLNHSDTHGRCGEIHSFLTGTGNYIDFANGAITHGTIPEGLDYYCDEKYPDFEKGYAFREAHSIVDKVLKCCHLPEEMGLWKAHNFIEMAADLWLYNKRTEFHGYLSKALNNREAILEISDSLSLFYNIPTAKIAMSFAIYGEHVNLGSVTSIELAKKYHIQTLKKHDISIDIKGAANVIEEAVEIVNQTMPEFLNFCQVQVTSLLDSINN